MKLKVYKVRKVILLLYYNSLSLLIKLWTTPLAVKTHS